MKVNPVPEGMYFMIYSCDIQEKPKSYRVVVLGRWIHKCAFVKTHRAEKHKDWRLMYANFEKRISPGQNPDCEKWT